MCNRRGKTRAAVGTILVLAASLLFAAQVLATGIGVSPAELELDQALRGGEYDETIWVMNPDDEAADYSLTASGDAGAWIRFYEEADSTTAIDRITVPAKGNKEVVVRFAIPQEAANGTYEATITVQTIPVEVASGQAVCLQADVYVRIDVTGTQVLSGVVEAITADDTEVNYPLRLNVYFRNTGNVAAQPKIVTAVYKGSSFITNHTHNDAQVKPGSTEPIPLELDTKGWVEGDYVVKVTVSLGNPSAAAPQIIARKDVQFKLLPVGTLTRAGELRDLSHEGDPIVGRVVKILADFVNTGQIESPAMFVGEVYRDGVLIETIESEELLVLPAENGLLKSYLELGAAGDYLIKGHVNYGGKLTSVKEISFQALPPQVAAAASGGGGLSRNTWIMIGTGGGIIVLGSILATSVIVQRRKRSTMSASVTVKRQTGG